MGIKKFRNTWNNKGVEMNKLLFGFCLLLVGCTTLREAQNDCQSFNGWEVGTIENIRCAKNKVSNGYDKKYLTRLEHGMEKVEEQDQEDEFISEAINECTRKEPTPGSLETLSCIANSTRTFSPGTSVHTEGLFECLEQQHSDYRFCDTNFKAPKFGKAEKVKYCSGYPVSPLVGSFSKNALLANSLAIDFQATCEKAAGERYLRFVRNNPEYKRFDWDEYKQQQMVKREEDKRQDRIETRKLIDGLSNIAQGLNQKNSKASYQNSGNGQSQCSSDFDCSFGKVCIKDLYSSQGVCGQSVNSHGIPTYSSPSLESVGPNMGRQCIDSTDCPFGFSCRQGNCLK